MTIEPLSKFLGNLPGAGGNPWIGAVYVVTLITGAGLIRFMFFSVRRNERGVWLRLGNVVYGIRDKRPKILVPGHPALRFPFVWRLVKVSVSIRTNRPPDVETMRFDPTDRQRRKWVLRCDIIWRVQTGAFRVTRAALRAEDLEETVVAIITNALRASVYAAPVGSLETDVELLASVKPRCKAQLAGLGVALTGIKITTLSPVDAQVLADAVAVSPFGAGTRPESP